MCTLTWFVKADGYELFFNRDERLTRLKAQLPSIHQQQGCQYISPIDSEAGGTWIASNQHGITVCLLNHYQFEQLETYKDWVSRGEIVRQFVSVTDLEFAEQQFAKLDLQDYRAFRMFIIDCAGKNSLFVWDGHQPRLEKNVTMPKSSSSVNAHQVKSIRKQLFADLNLVELENAEAYLQYHASHHPVKSEQSVCMHRDDAKTVSLSHVSVSAGNIVFKYCDGSPCETALANQVELTIQPLESAAVTGAIV